MKENRAQNWIEKTIRWTARIGSLISIGLLMAFALGGNEGLPDVEETATRGLIFFPFGIMLGMTLGWWKELLGGIVTVVSLIGFYVWHLMESGGLPNGPYFILFALPGVLFLLAWCLGRKSPNHQRPSAASSTDKN